MIPGLSIGVMIFVALCALIIPIGLMLFFEKKFTLNVIPFFAGCGTMLLFALVLEQMCHMFILSTPVGDAIVASPLLTALYGGIMAGIFEECGRFITMKFVLKSKHDDDHNALMYGAGHGGFEVFYLLVVTSLSTLPIAYLNNTGRTDLILDPLEEADRIVMEQSLVTMREASAFEYALPVVERLAAVAAQIALSVIVWFAVTRKDKLKYLFFAILLHALLDFIPSFINSLNINIWLIEFIIWIMSALYVFIAWKIWKANYREPVPAEEVVEEVSEVSAGSSIGQIAKMSVSDDESVDDDR